MSNEREWTDWLTHPPSYEDSKFIEAYWTADGVRHYAGAVSAYTMVNGELEWMHRVPDPSSPYRWRVVKQQYNGWRYLGPAVPALHEQQAHDALYVWRFHEAPGELASLSLHGGDEDWLLLLLSLEDRPGWTWSEVFGSNVSEHVLPDGRCVLISAHS